MFSTASIARNLGKSGTLANHGTQDDVLDEGNNYNISIKKGVLDKPVLLFCWMPFKAVTKS
jgi:hypothetical protein